MSAYLILDDAEHRLAEIIDYTQANWGDEQAVRYFNGFVERFRQIAARAFPWRPIPAVFDLEGYVCRYERHFIYWKILGDGTVGIVTVLHERMHQIERVRKAFVDS